MAINHRRVLVSDGLSMIKPWLVIMCSNQAFWYQSFILCFSVEDPVPLHCDNKGAVDLAVNPVTGRCSKHIPIRHHVIREYVERGDITLIRTPTLEMLADGFTKSLPKATLMRHAYDMG